MKGKRYSDEQITYALRQAEGGTPVADVCRQLGVSEASFYLWKKKYGKLGMSEIRELRQLRDENARLKRLVADLTLDKHILGEVVRKKLWGQRAVAYKNRLAGQPLTASRTDQNESRGTSTMIETLRPKTSPNTSSRSTIELGVTATSVALALSDLKQSIGAVGTVSTESWELQYQETPDRRNAFACQGLGRNWPPLLRVVTCHRYGSYEAQ